MTEKSMKIYRLEKQIKQLKQKLYDKENGKFAKGRRLY